MSSIGASCANVYVMKKRQEEKLKKLEEEGRKRDKSDGEDKVGGDGNDSNSNSGFARNKKVHPHNSQASNSGKAGGS
ncbi:hypothetical protein ACJRO7_033372 [Eucalyptus globulus]|uniref:Uncharacterized protein n=1 Tax=Eucalyptus globulus TaxID=34317 RepID=A0ABD3JSM4_EUCGL